MDYIKSYPKNYKKGKKYPLLIHLHGTGCRGNDLILLKQAGPLFEIENGRKIPFIIVAPQCKADTWFDVMEQLVFYISNIIKQEDVDSDRVYLSGVSMGGYACWTVAMMHPEWFAAIVPVCGGGMYWNAEKLKDIPVWAFHGEEDDVIFVQESINMINAVNNAGGSAKLTIYPNIKHDSWKQAFGNDEIYNWLLKQKRSYNHGEHQ